jgi:hypothetical protein
MTSYSTYATGTLKIVDGTLASTFRPEPDADNDDLQNDLYMLGHAIASGAARALLDVSHDVTDDPDGSEQTEVYAEQWHSADEGWELEALTPEAREKLEQRALSFTTQNLADVVWLAHRIAFDPRYSSDADGLWHHDLGMGFYRVGQLLGYELAHQGVGFFDYTGTDGKVITDRLSLWVDENGDYAYEDAWIDSTEAPCLLHLG